MKHVVFGTAGHIDHGKSALVIALTGTDPDRWEEEKRRGITIDLGFAFLDPNPGLRIALIDVPGHERFVRNMLAGATGIDAVLLVVAADESIKPQTREHFEICRLLGIHRGLVAITKSDLVGAAALEAVRRQVREWVAGSFLEGAPIIPVSSRTGEGIAALKAEMARLGENIAAKSSALPFRLPVDRAFVIKGFGSVVTGTLIAGRIAKEDEVEVFPLGRRCRVRGVEVHNQAAAGAVAGQRTALNLAGIEVKDLYRGLMLAPPGEFEATDRLDCAIQLLPSARPLKDRSRAHFHCWTTEAIAEVILQDSKELSPGERTFARLRLSAPGLFMPGDRFILRQLSPVVTMGGGIVLDNRPSGASFRSPEVRQFLELVERADDAARLELHVQREGETGIKEMAARMGWTRTEVERIAAELRERIAILGKPPFHLVHADCAQALSENILLVLTRFHAANPLLPGAPKEYLRGQAKVRSKQPSPHAFAAALEALETAGKITLHGELVALAGRTIKLSAEELRAKEQISQAFETAGLRPPASAEALASLPVGRQQAEKILQLLLKEKTLFKIAGDLIVHQSALGRLRRLLAERKAQSDRLSVPDFKALTGVTRKYAIPLLEYLDRERITRRSGDHRVIL
ncbi:MAG: selenocysteine-specific translation elongation factor [Acidobacteriota bacterium]|nr:selenocysteine-specific translation elongation factor [Acidobacteriota bacterium]